MKSVYIGDKEYKLDDEQVYIMGILNITPDSFSDGSKYNHIDAALKHAERMISEGASIIDVGGESTRPGYTMICEEEEIDRIVGVIEHIRHRFDISISVDTYKSQVAKAALEVGADMVNDIWGLLWKDGSMAEVVKYYGASICMMHNDENSMKSNDMNIIIDRLKKSIDVARTVGIEENRMLIDPGIGFAKNYENNIYVMKHLNELSKLELPLLLGVSNKSMIGIATGTEVCDRLGGSVAAALYGINKGCKFLRVHNVAAHKQAIDMWNTIIKA